ncbi:MAG TPA: efflux RND transporter periplasmic adaptor subunit [Steroidobacteraceae bacterium]|nr:efflux RND transporter periplasmic adaptor subunit [Steroidobacteraceae bacterium]
MNDIARTGEVEIAVGARREPWWRSPGRLLRRSRLASVIVVLACLILLAGIGWYLAHRNAANQQFGFNARFRNASTVGVADAARADVPLYLEALGTVTPLATAVVRPQVSGQLAQILYHEGQMVKAGQPLAQIDPKPFELALNQAEGNLARDEANLVNARQLLERDRLLLKQDSIAQQDVDTQESTVKQLDGVVLADRAALNTAHLNVTWARVTAPISGRVGLRPVDVGNYVSTGDATGIASITQIDPIDVVFTLPADAVTKIQARLKKPGPMPATVLDRTRTITLGQGAFATLDNQIDDQTGTVKAKARFANPDGQLFPQQFVNIRLLLDTVKDAVVVPSAAVRHGPQGDYVYVVAADRTAHITQITVGPAVDDKVSIASGLTVGQRVITEGGDRLVDGATVRLPGQPPPAFQKGNNKKFRRFQGGGGFGGG